MSTTMYTTGVGHKMLKFGILFSAIHSVHLLKAGKNFIYCSGLNKSGLLQSCKVVPALRAKRASSLPSAKLFVRGLVVW